MTNETRVTLAGTYVETIEGTQPDKIHRLAHMLPDIRSVAYLTAMSVNKGIISTNFAHTNIYSNSFGTTYDAVGVTVGDRTSMRMGYWILSPSFFPNVTGTASNIFYGAGRGAGPFVDPQLALVWRRTTPFSLQVRRPLTASTSETLYTLDSPAILEGDSQWKHIGITHYAHASNGFLSMYLNGELILNYTGDTRLSYWNGSSKATTSTFDRCWFGGQLFGSTNLGTNTYYDDLYVDSYDDQVDARVPMKRFLVSRPNGVGTDSEWTPSAGSNYQNVDDGVRDDDTTYNSAQAINLRDTFQTEDVTIPPFHVAQAIVRLAYAKRLGSSSAKLRFVSYDGATYQVGDAQSLLADYSPFVWDREEEEPDGTRWDAAVDAEGDFNSMQHGYQSAGTF